MQERECHCYCIMKTSDKIQLGYLESSGLTLFGSKRNTPKSYFVPTPTPSITLTFVKAKHEIESEFSRLLK